jgi:hypothetical protein
MKLFRVLAIVSLVLVRIVSSHAQPAAVQQLENTRQIEQQQTVIPAVAVGTNAPELYPGENVDVGPQRILRVTPPRKYFDALVDSQVFYTDDANFASDPSRIGSAVFVNTVQAALAPTPYQLGPGKFAPSLGVISQWYNYSSDRMTSLDFNAQTLFLSGRYALDKWQFGLGASYTRLVNQAGYKQSYREFLPTLGVERFFPITDKLLFSIGDQIDYHFSKVPMIFGSRTDINDRLDNDVNLALSWQVNRHFVIQPYYRFQYSHYDYDTKLDSDRDDLLNTFGVTAAYYFNKYVSLRAFFNYNRKQTDDTLAPRYHELDGGIGASFDIKF